MSEIYDQGLLPPNVHHARPENPGRSDEETDRERADEEPEGTEPSETRGPAGEEDDGDPGRVDGETGPAGTGVESAEEPPD